MKIYWKCLGLINTICHSAVLVNDNILRHEKPRDVGHGPGIMRCELYHFQYDQIEQTLILYRWICRVINPVGARHQRLEVQPIRQLKSPLEQRK